MNTRDNILNTLIFMSLLTLGLGAHPALGQSPERALRGFVDPVNHLAPTHFPVPASWRQPSDPSRLELNGPGGLKVQWFGTLSGQTPAGQPYDDLAQKTGRMIRPVPSFEELLARDLGPLFERAAGLRLTRSYPLPAVANKELELGNAINLRVTGRAHYAIGTDWVDRKGKPSFHVITMEIVQDTVAMRWDVRWIYLQAPETEIERAKEDLVYALSHAQHNAHFIQDLNARLAQQYAQHDAQHQAIMGALNAQAAANTRAHQQRMAAMDASHERFMNNFRDDSAHRAAINNIEGDGGHQAFVNTIREVDVVYNPSTEQNVEVQSGANHVFVNGDNQVIHTDDHSYDPNADPNLNGGWNQGY